MTMDKFIFGKKILSQLLVMIFIISGCMPSDVPSAQTGKQIAETTGTTDGGDIVEPEIVVPPKVEIRHLIEPNLSTDLSYTSGTGVSGGGSYVRKLTIPKNFAGRLYVAGINMGSLANRHVKVRFKFGVGHEIVTIPATVAQAPGITPQTEISVLVMDLRGEPFRDIRLPYDLFDYNEYPLKANGKLEDSVEPTQDNRDTGLYCRGLRLEDDPTFQGVGACDEAGEDCLYAYAKVLDQGLVKKTSSIIKVPLEPTMAQVKSIAGLNYLQDYMSQKLLKPLPDTIATTTVGGNTPSLFVFSQALNPVNAAISVPITFSFPTNADWTVNRILGYDYVYRGPYRLVNTPDWQFGFSHEKLDGEKRLFRKNSWVNYPRFLTDPLADDYAVSDDIDPQQSRLYYNSYLFPLATKLNIPANVAHLSSTHADEARTEKTLPVAGKTDWMDGSNARAQSRNLNMEHIGSCNVTATMEIIAKDDNNVDYVVSLANDVKLQLVRPSQYRTDIGNEVLYNNFKNCSTNSACGSSECCFNNRCWDETLVSQCFDSSSTQGNRNIGESCLTDLECSSLCCNKTSGQCSPHNSIVTPAVLCSKPIGDFCIAKEWCQKTNVIKCLKVRTGTDPVTGSVTCRQHCYNSQEYGDCKNGSCVPPEQPQIPEFNPDEPGICNDAVPAPNF
jgi:hypothetical protein